MLDQNTSTPRLIDKYGSWDAVYHKTPPNELPWNAGAPDPELVKLIESGIIPIGRAIDVGTGPGHDAIFLAKKHFKVLAIDISSVAIELAQANAKLAGVGVAIDYRAQDILALSSPDGTATFINDRVCFEVLDADDRENYAAKISKVLIPGGHLFLRTFSKNEPPGDGPHRFTRKEIEDVFSEKFEFLDFHDGILAGPRQAKIYVCLLRKK
jgi:2-polyprenyl-3-methyl-5-hydroxy-6-metoxy-1,4-benzoquinol methylase